MSYGLSSVAESPFSSLLYLESVYYEICLAIDCHQVLAAVMSLVVHVVM